MKSKADNPLFLFRTLRMKGSRKKINICERVIFNNEILNLFRISSTYGQENVTRCNGKPTT